MRSQHHGSNTQEGPEPFQNIAAKKSCGTNAMGNTFDVPQIAMKHAQERAPHWEINLPRYSIPLFCTKSSSFRHRFPEAIAFGAPATEILDSPKLQRSLE
jgi:hypothetical protein